MENGVVGRRFVYIAVTLSVDELNLGFDVLQEDL